jgi:hypothetical protein
MTIRFLCPMGHRLSVPDERSGKKGRCPICQQRVIIPVLEPQPSGKQKRAPLRDVADVDATEDDDEPATADEPLPPSIGQRSPLFGSGSLEHITFGPLPASSHDEPDPRADERRAPPPYVPIRLDPPPEPPIGSSARPADASRPPNRPPESRSLPAADPAAFENIEGLVDQFAPPSPPLPPPPPRPSEPPIGVPAAGPPFTMPAASPVERAPPPDWNAPPRGGGPLPAIQASSREPEGYEPEPAWVQTVYFLGVGMLMVTLFCAIPAMRHLNLAAAPGWARLVLLLCALQLVYIAWIVTLPDWSTVWVGMLVFALVAAIYGMGMAIAMATPLDQPLPWGMNDVRYTAAGWCMAVVLLAGLMTYFCGRISFRWRRAFEQAKARRSNAR